jgi:hypothetical protein
MFIFAEKGGDAGVEEKKIIFVLLIYVLLKGMIFISMGFFALFPVKSRETAEGEI